MAYEFLDELHQNTSKLNSIKDKILAFEKSANKSQLVYSKLVNDLKQILEIENE